MKRSYLLFVFVALFAAALFTAGMALGVEVPSVTPLDFPTETPTALEAHWLWTAVAGEIALALVALLGQVVLSVIDRVKNAKLAKACRVIYDAVMVCYHEYVQVVKAASSNGKMTVEQKNEALNYAYRKAVELAKTEGFDLLKVFAKETVLALIERFVGESKGRKITAPLPDLLP